jgi:hypothetical protein
LYILRAQPAIVEWVNFDCCYFDNVRSSRIVANPLLADKPLHNFGIFDATFSKLGSHIGPYACLLCARVHGPCWLCLSTVALRFVGLACKWKVHIWHCTLGADCEGWVEPCSCSTSSTVLPSFAFSPFFTFLCMIRCSWMCCN